MLLLRLSAPGRYSTVAATGKPRLFFAVVSLSDSEHFNVLAENTAQRFVEISTSSLSDHNHRNLATGRRDHSAIPGPAVPIERGKRC